VEILFVISAEDRDAAGAIQAAAESAINRGANE
jgi:hypothetical protein